jgi:hypothetical protein
VAEAAPQNGIFRAWADGIADNKMNCAARLQLNSYSLAYLRLWPYIGGMVSRSSRLKPDELFRNVPANIHELRLALAGLPKDMKVIGHSETGVSEKTVDELRARTTWPPGLVVTTPRELHPKSVVKISKAT